MGKQVQVRAALLCSVLWMLVSRDGAAAHKSSPHDIRSPLSVLASKVKLNQQLHRAVHTAGIEHIGFLDNFILLRDLKTGTIFKAAQKKLVDGRIDYEFSSIVQKKERARQRQKNHVALDLSAEELAQLRVYVKVPTNVHLLRRALALLSYHEGKSYTQIADELRDQGMPTDKHTVGRLVQRFAQYPRTGSRVRFLSRNLNLAGVLGRSNPAIPPLRLTTEEWTHLKQIFLLSTAPVVGQLPDFWSWFRRAALIGLHDAGVLGSEGAAVLRALGFAKTHRKTQGAWVRKLHEFSKEHPDKKDERLDLLTSNVHADHAPKKTIILDTEIVPPIVVRRNKTRVAKER